MPIKLNKAEKCYLVALFGDIPDAARARLFAIGQCPVQIGPLVMQAGYEFRDRQIKVLPRPRRRRTLPDYSR